MTTSSLHSLPNTRARSLVTALALLLAFSAAGLAQHANLQLRRLPETRGTMLAARSNGCAVLLADGRVLITGGVADNVFLSSAEFYETDGHFSPAAPLLEARSDHACSILPDGNVLVAGGRTAGGVTNTAELFDPSSGQWKAGPPMPWSRAGAAFVQLNDGRLLLSGGIVGEAVSNDIVFFDPASLAFQPASARLSSPRRDHAMAVLKDGRVVMGGGFDGQTFLASIELFDPATGLISSAGKLSTPGSGLTATTLLDGRVVFVGGGTETNESGAVQIFDPKSGVVILESTIMMQPRRGHAALRLADNNTVLLVGGTSRGESVAPIEAYVPWTHRVETSGTLEVGRTAATVLSLGERGEALIAGGTSALRALSTANVTCVPTVRTDMADYSPGTTVTITGSCWLPGGNVEITLTEVPDSFGESPIHLAPTQVAPDGTFISTTFAPDINDVGVTFYLTASESFDATGSLISPQLTAQTSFTDALSIDSFAVRDSSCSAVISAAAYGGTVCADAKVALTGGSGYRVQWYNSATISTATLVYDDPGVGSPPNFHSLHVINSLGAGNVWTLLICKTGNVGSCANGNRENITTIAIGKKALLISGVTANSKPFDGTTVATLNTSSATLVGVVAGDTVTLSTSSASGQFADANVGNAKPVTISGLSLAGVDAAKYSLTQPTATASITARGVTGSFTAANKAYNGDSSATVLTRSLTGVLGGDQVSLSGGTASFSDSNAGSGKTVTLNGATLAGAGAANYSLTSVSTTTADITALHITGSFTADNKVYDGSNSATVLTRSLPGLIAGDAVSLTGGTASFNNKTVGSGKLVTLTGASLSGAGVSNYVLDSVANASADITALQITGNFTASGKVYDGTASATVVTRSLVGVLGSDAVSLTGGTATFDDKRALDNKAVTLTGASLSGADAVNYALASVATATANVTPLHITGGFTAADKMYDGNTSASVVTRSLIGAINADIVSLSDGTATFSDKIAANGKTVTLANALLSGADHSNYVLDSVATTTANITPLHLIGSFTADYKVYDGTTTATVLTRSLPGAIMGDTVALIGGTAAFSDKNAGLGKTVNLNGATLGGNDAANYLLDSVAAATANITPLPISGSFTAGSKQYDGSAVASVLTRSLAGVLGTDGVTLNGGTASFGDKAAGIGKTVSLTGANLAGPDAGNYTLTSVATTTANITPLHISGSFSAADKQYDGNSSAIVSARSLVNAIAGDAVTLTGGTATFSDKSVGTAKTVTLTGAALGGSDALNYILDSVATALASITQAHLVGSFTADNKLYDGTTTATVLTRSLPGAIVGDTVALVGGTAAFSDKNAGLGKTVNLNGATLGGNDGPNYVLDSVAPATANITPLPISGSFTAGSKQYDGSAVASVLTRSLTGVLGTDGVTLNGGTASFADKAAGIGRTVSLTGANLGGPDAGNYTLTSVATTTANITPLHISGSFSAADKQYDGNSSAIVSARSLVNAVAGDAVTLTGGTATFSDKSVGTAKTVTLTGAALSGSDALNYILDSVATALASITQAHLVGSFTAANKVYDGTTTATVLTRSLSGAVMGDAVALIGGTAAFSDKNAGTGKTVNLNSASLGGDDAANYVLGSVAAATANITPLPIFGAFTTRDKQYDGTTVAVVLTTSVSGLLGSDVVSLTGGTAAFNNRNVGTGKSVTLSSAVLTGASAANYSLSSVSPTTAAITAAPLSIMAVPCTKIYDGTTSAPGCIPVVLTGLQTGDSVSGLAETYDSKFAGTGKTLTVSAFIVSDGNGGANYSVTTLPNAAGVITNFPPAVTLTGPASGLVSPAGTSISFTGTFTDNPGDTHTAVWTLRDSSGNAPVTIPGIVTDAPGGGGTVTASYAFPNMSGVFSVKLTVTDINGLSASADVVGGPGGMPAMVIIYDPTAGFVTGGGWITSSPGAYVPNPALGGKASFGFVSKYAKGQTVPSGQTQFTFSVGNLDFHSTSYQWLVVSGPMAQYKGNGTINGSGNYGFLLTARDGSKAGADGFRIKITDPGGVVVYDNMLSADDSNTTNNVQTLGGGSVQIHN